MYRSIISYSFSIPSKILVHTIERESLVSLRTFSGDKAPLKIIRHGKRMKTIPTSNARGKCSKYFSANLTQILAPARKLKQI